MWSKKKANQGAAAQAKEADQPRHLQVRTTEGTRRVMQEAYKVR